MSADDQDFRACLRTFAHGLVRPGGVALGVALVFNLVAFAWLVTRLSDESMMLERGPYLAADPTDYDLFSTMAALRLQRDSPETPRLVLLGGSSIRASLLEADLVEALRAAGLEWDVAKLCTSRQSLWESLTLVDSIPRGSVGVLVIGVGAGAFVAGPDDLRELQATPRLGLRSPAFDDELRNSGFDVRRQTGNYVIDNFGFIAGRYPQALSTLTGREVPVPLDSRYVGLAATDDWHWRQIAERVDERLEAYDDNRAANLELLHRIIERVQSRTRMQVIVVETPVDPRFVEEFDNAVLYERHRQELRNFARAMNVRFLSLPDAVRYEPGDFYDWTHLNDREAIRRSSNALVAELLRARPGAAVVAGGAT